MAGRLTVDGWTGSGASFTLTPADDARKLVRWHDGGHSSEIEGMTMWGYHILVCRLHINTRVSTHGKFVL